MYKEENESWRIVESSDLSLNFALFTGCLYGLIDDVDVISNNRLWPPKCEINKLTESLSLLKEQWNKWFNSMINDKGKKVILKQKLDLTNNMFNPPNFSEFPYCELREYCKNSWQPFIQWWEMVGGGKNALSYLEGFGNEKIYKYINEFENIVQRKVKPFNLYIDLVYTGTSQIIEVNSEAIYSSEEVIDFAWELSQDDLHASYARIKSMKELESEIERALREDNYNIVACYKQNVLCGVCIYFWISDEKYAQTRAFLIRGDYDQIADEFICHIRKQFPGYELLIGVPFSNLNANGYFKKKNIECIDASIVTKLYNLEYNINQNHNSIQKITENNFEEYAIFHDKYAVPLEMYYNSKNLQKDMDIFRIFVFSQDETIRGSIFVKIVRDTAEVFGLFIDKKYENNGIESILINDMLMQLYNEFGSIRELTYFIVEDCVAELNSALAAGFEISDKYRCYRFIL